MHAYGMREEADQAPDPQPTRTNNSFPFKLKMPKLARRYELLPMMRGNNRFFPRNNSSKMSSYDQ